MNQTERYHATLSFELARLDIDADAQGKPFEVRPSPWVRFRPSYQLHRLALTIRQEPESKTTLVVDWEFDELFNDNDPINDFGTDTTWTISRRGHMLYLPKPADAYFPDSICLVYFAQRLVWNAVMRLSLLSNPQVFTSFMDAQGGGILRCVGEAIPIDRKVFSMRVAYRGRAITQASINSSMAHDLHDHEVLIYIADEQLSAGDLRGAIINLTTAMELAFYERERATKLPSKLRNFTPERYLRKREAPGIAQWIQVHGLPPPGTIKAVETLWGTRNEIVHNGRLKIRPPGTGMGTALALLETADLNHYYAFRSELSDCLVWLGFPALINAIGLLP